MDPWHGLLRERGVRAGKRRAAEPTLFLDEVEEDEPTEKLFDEVTERFQGAVAFLAFESGQVDAEDLGEGGILDQVMAKVRVVALVGGEEFIAEFLDGEGIEDVSESRRAAMAGEKLEA